VRSVPAMGKRDFDDDASRIGASVVKTSQMSGGFREMAKMHLPSAKEAVAKEEARVASEMASNRFTLPTFKIARTGAMPGSRNAEAKPGSTVALPLGCGFVKSSSLPPAKAKGR